MQGTFKVITLTVRVAHAAAVLSQQFHHELSDNSELSDDSELVKLP